MAIYHVSLGFAQIPDTQLDEFAGQIIAGLTNNAAFPTPAASIADVTKSQEAFEVAMTAMAQGGTQATAVKNVARQALVGLLRQNAIYVQGMAKNDLPTILSSGYQVTSTNTSQTPLDAPVILALTNEASGQLLMQLQGSYNAKSYDIEISSAPGVWVHSTITTQTRNVILQNLVPGTTYAVRARAVGGSTGFSNWSDPVSHMAT